MRSVRTKEGFWRTVEAQEQELRALPHNVESGRLSRVERVGEEAAVLLYREHEESRRAHRMQRYLSAELHVAAHDAGGAMSDLVSL